MYNLAYWLQDFNKLACSAPDPAGQLTTLPRPLVGWWGGTPPTFPTFRSRHIRNEVVIGPRDDGVLGPAVALDGPDQNLAFPQTIGLPDLPI